jgi:hypothetical protein
VRLDLLAALHAAALRAGLRHDELARLGEAARRQAVEAVAEEVALGLKVI